MCYLTDHGPQKCLFFDLLPWIDWLHITQPVSFRWHTRAHTHTLTHANTHTHTKFCCTQAEGATHTTLNTVSISSGCVGRSEWSIRSPAAMQRSNPSTPETVARTMHTAAKNQSQQVPCASQHTICNRSKGQGGVWTYVPLPLKKSFIQTS